MRHSCSKGFSLETLEARQLMAAPVVTELVAQPAIANSWADVIEFRARATDADGNNTIRGVTFFRDHDENGVWTPGVDQDLGLVTERNGAGQYVKTPTPASWPSAPASASSRTAPHHCAP